MEMCGNAERLFQRTEARVKPSDMAPEGKRSANSPREMSACSACAGDYEDPGRTAWPPEEENAEAAERTEASEFPDRVPDDEV